MRRRRILALIIAVALLAGPLVPAFAGCTHEAPACDVLCSAGRIACVSPAIMTIGLSPFGRAPERPALRPSLLVLAVPKPPPKPASPSV